jgi:hypothetical protein
MRNRIVIASLVVCALTIATFAVIITRNQRPSSSLWVGDSYTAGTGAANGTRDAESCLTSKMLGWTCYTDAQGGTGFVNNGHANQPHFQPLIDRLPSTARTVDPDVVVIDAGRNDRHFPLPRVLDAMRRYVAALRKAFPDATFVQIVPFSMRQTQESYDGAMADAIRELMDDYDGYVIDPIAEGWAGGGHTSSLTIANGHPSTEGHRYLAVHFAADLKKFDL